MSDEKPINERVTALETRMDAVDQKFDENQNMLKDFFVRFDDHIDAETKADLDIQVGLAKIVAKLETTNETLTEIKDQSASTTFVVNNAQAAWKTLVTIVSVVAVLISGAWAVYEFSVIHPSATTETK
jgi:Mg2+ and Co2+ transporter CorA